MDKINSSIAKVQKYAEDNKFLGYDPYDTLNSWIPFHWLGKYGQIAAIQIQKRNPINIRPLMGIKKEIMPKGFGLFLHGYSLLYMTDKRPEYLEKMEYFFNYFLENKLEDFKGYCWTKNWALTYTDKFKRPKVDPSSVLASFIGEAIFEYYNATKNPKAIEVLEGICEFIKVHVPIHRDGDEMCISYTTLRQDFVHNANLHAAEIFAKTYSITKKEEYKDYAIKATNYSVRRQREDGAWVYKIFPDGSEKKQIDFHQGFVLNSIHSVYTLVESKPEYLAALKKGAEFYFNEQFKPDGSSLFRYPKRYPIDIHNQAQGMITFSLLKDLDPKYLPFAEKIADWTIDNMQTRNGHFIYRILPSYKIKIPYMRWSQAWAFLSMSHLVYIKHIIEKGK